MPPKINDKFTRKKMPRSTKSFLRKKEAFKRESAGKRTPEMFAAEKLHPLIDWIMANPASDDVTSPHSRIQVEFAKHSKTVPTIAEF